MLNVGIIGLANIAVNELIPAILSNRSFNLIKIGSRSKLGSVFKIDNLIFQLCDYDSVISDPSIHIVYIPLPNSFHYEWIKKALINKKHVICEKSLCLSTSELKKLHSISKKNKLLIFENFQFKYHPQNLYVKNLLDNNFLGDIRLMKAWFGFPPFNDKNNIRYSKNLGGGSLLDAGAYPIKLTTYFFGYDFSVSNSNLYMDKNYDVDICGNGVLVNSNGITSHIAFGFDNHYQCSYEVWGSKGVIRNNRVFTAKKDFECSLIIQKNGTEDDIKINPANHFVEMLNAVKQLIEENNFTDNNYENLIQCKLLSDFRTKSSIFHL